MDREHQGAFRALPFVAAMLLLTLLPLTQTQALFGFGKQETSVTAPGAPIAKDLELKAYGGVPCPGTLQAVDNEGESVVFSIVQPPKKGVLELSEDGSAFVYTPGKNRGGKDRFTFIATDESGNASAEATVTIRIERMASGVRYSDTDASSAATAAADLAEHGVFVGEQVGGEWFFEPERVVSRGEFTAMALAAAGVEPVDVGATGFCDDAEIPAWAKSVAAAALKCGVVKGTPTDEGFAYRADADVTLGEAAVMLNRVLKVTNVDPETLYAPAEDAWSAQAIANLSSVSVVPSGGFSEGAASRSLTRAQAAELLSAAMTLAEGRRG